VSASRTAPWTAAGLVLYRDVALAFRRWEQITHPVVFFLMVATLFPLALNPKPSLLADIGAGVVWVSALLSSMLALETLFRADVEDGTLEQLTLTGQPLALLVLAKTVAHWLVSGVPLVLASPVVAVAFGADGTANGVLMASIALGTAVLSLIGAVGAALTLSSRRGSVLLSLLVLPLVMPVLIFGARATDLALHGDAAAQGPLWLLGALLVLALTLTPLAAAAALRISLE
jgi:heme exporter protein B